MKKFKVSLILVAMGFLLSIGVMAQAPRPPAGQGTSGNQPPAGPTGVPVDPGTGVFLILAVGYGLKKIYNARRDTAI